jgi:flagellar hook assembly protein FlgD
VPNPLNSITTITYETPATEAVTITLYDESGRLVKELVNGIQTAGEYHVTWDAEHLTSGIYLYQMKSAAFTQTRRLMIIK